MKRCQLSILGTLLMFGYNLMPLLVDATTQGQSDLLKSSSIVFVGTVRRVGAAAIAEVPQSPNDTVVKVDGIIQQPPGLQLKVGDEVTVLVQEPRLFKDGTQATFYAVPWIIGKGVAVREVGHEIIDASARESAVDASRKHVEQLKRESEESDLRARINAADVILVGQVTVVRPGLAGLQRSVTEHDPDWQEAIVEVTSWIKGLPRQQKVIVRFAASRDVAWYRAPKLKERDENVFILKKAEPSTSKAAPGKTSEQVYFLLNPNDLLPIQQADHVRALAAQSIPPAAKEK